MAVLTCLSLLSLIAGYQIKPTRRIPTSLSGRFAVGALRAVARCLARAADPLVRARITYFYGLAGALYLTLFESPIRSTPATRHRLPYRCLHGHAGAGHHLRQFSGHTDDHAPGGDRADPDRLRRAYLHHPAGGRGEPKSALFLGALFLMAWPGAFRRAAERAFAGAVEPERRGRILSANLLFNNLFGIVAVLIQYVVSAEFSVTPRHQLLLYAIPTAPSPPTSFS